MVRLSMEEDADGSTSEAAFCRAGFEGGVPVKRTWIPTL
jgi:hypothetical protein